MILEMFYVGIKKLDWKQKGKIQENKQMNFKKIEVGAYKAKRSCHHPLRQKGLG